MTIYQIDIIASIAVKKKGKLSEKFITKGKSGGRGEGRLRESSLNFIWMGSMTTRGTRDFCFFGITLKRAISSQELPFKRRLHFSLHLTRQ